MKRIYVAHPLRGAGATDEKYNRIMVNFICHGIKTEHPDYLIFSPIHALSFFPAAGDQTEVFRHCRG